jgi:hypothetical protein
LGLIDYLAAATHLRFLLFPPLAVFGYALFLEPYGRHTGLRDGVVGAVLGAMLGAAGVAWVPAGPLRVALVTAVGIVLLYQLRIDLRMGLAVAFLSLVVGAEGFPYALSIAASSLVLALIFRLWRPASSTRPAMGPTSWPRGRSSLAEAELNREAPSITGRGACHRASTTLTLCQKAM